MKCQNLHLVIDQIYQRYYPVQTKAYTITYQITKVILTYYA